MLDLRRHGLSGLDPDSLEGSLLIDRQLDREAHRYLEVLTVVQAIQEATSAIVSGEGKFTATNENLKRLRAATFPELGDVTEDKAKKTAALLEAELQRGPMEIQALDYGSPKKRNRR